MKHCFICNDPLAFSQDHHIIPQAAGGKAGPKQAICGGCHNDLHRLIEIIIKNGSNYAIQIARGTYSANKAKVILKYAHIGAKHIIMYKKNPMDDSPFLLNLNEKEKQALKQIALDNNTSMQKWVYNLITNILKQRGYLK